MFDVVPLTCCSLQRTIARANLPERHGDCIDMSEQCARYDVSDAGQQQDRRSQWEKIHTSLQLRWPELKSDELRALPKDEDSIKHYVTQRTQASNEEVEKVMNQHTERGGQATASISDSAKQRAEVARDAAASYYERTERQMSAHPGQSALISFVSGFALGALITSLLMQATPKPEPSGWEKYRPKHWNS